MAKAKETSGDSVAAMIAMLEPFDPTVRSRILRTVSTYFSETSGSTTGFLNTFRSPDTIESHPSVPFSKETAMTPKQFMAEKRPQTDVERVACLAYYLTHQRDVTQFKTTDISKLNTEAAQVRFSNAAMAVDNALKTGYLAHASKGHKQLSALGEQYIQALPDREAAKALLAGSRPSRRRRSKNGPARKKTAKR